MNRLKYSFFRVILLASFSLQAMQSIKTRLLPFDLKKHGEQSRAIFSDAFGVVPGQFSRDLSSSDSMRIAVFTVNDVVEGVVVYKTFDHQWKIEYLAVRKGSRKKGYGRSIVDLLEQQAKSSGIKKMALVAKNDENIGIFKKMGFKQDVSISSAKDNQFMVKDL